MSRPRTAWSSAAAVSSCQLTFGIARVNKLLISDQDTDASAALDSFVLRLAPENIKTSIHSRRSRAQARSRRGTHNILVFLLNNAAWSSGPRCSLGAEVDEGKGPDRSGLVHGLEPSCRYMHELLVVMRNYLSICIRAPING